MKILKIVNILALVLLIAGCDLFQEPQLNLGENTALVKVDLGGNARAILPDLDIYDDLKYVLSIKGGSGNNAAPLEPKEIEWWGGEVELPFGNWIITVTASVNDGSNDIDVASGTVPLTVSSMVHYVTVPVNLPVLGKKGTIEYTVSYPSGGSAELKLVKWPIQGGTAVIDESSVTDGTTVTVSDVDSGMYFLTVSATLNLKKITKTQIVHVYGSSTTNINYNFTETDFASSTVKLSGTFNITVNSVAAQNVLMEAVIEFDNAPTRSFAVKLAGSSWEVDMPPFAEGEVIISVRFYNSDGIEFNRVHDISSTGVTSNTTSNIVINVKTITLSGYADVIDAYRTESASVDIFNVERDGDDIYYYWIASAEIDMKTFFWQTTIDAFVEPAEIFFEICRYDIFDEQYWYDSGYDNVLDVFESNISNINISYGKIYLSGTVNVTVTGQGKIGQTFLNIGTAQTGMNRFNVDQFYYWEPESLNFSWVTWVNSEVENLEGSGEIDVLNSTLYFQLSVNVPAGTGSVSTSKLIDQTVVTGINLTGTITNFTP